MILPVPDTTIVVPAAQPSVNLPPVTGTTTNNPDGSTTTKNKTAVTNISPYPGDTVDDPIVVVPKQTETETTRTCTAGGSCTESQSTTQESPKTQEAAKTDCQLNGKAAGCIELGTPSSVDVPTETRSSSFSYTALSLNAVCPAPLSFTVANRPFSMSFSYLCQFATAIRAMVLLCAFVRCVFHHVWWPEG